MAYPDYSIVIISVTTNGVTTDFAQSFFNDELAKKYYKQAVADGKRAFYYEKPRPTRFVRNDDQPLVANTEKGLENVPLAAGGAEQKIGEIAEDIRRWTAPIAIANAFGVQEQLDAKLFKLGEETYGIWKGFNNFLRRALIGTTYTQYGQVVFQVTISNKRVTFRADGNGEFIVPPEIDKLWPNEGEITWTPPLDQSGIEVMIQPIGVPIALPIGIKRNKKVHDGTQVGGTTTEEYTYVPAGLSIYETETKIWRSDGAGWYTLSEKEVTQPPCPNIGAELSRNFIQDIVYPIVLSDGLTEYVNIGQKYEVVTVGQNCEDVNGVLDTISPNGTIVFETETTYYKSNGEGSVYEEAKPTDGGGDNGGDNGGGGEPPSCPPAGEFIRKEIINDSMGQSTWSVGGQTGSYAAYKVVRDITADGNCGEQDGEQYDEFIEEGTTIAEFVDANNEYEYVVFAASSGSYDYYATPIDNYTGSDDGSYVTYDPDLEGGGVQYPEGPTNEPCPPAGQYTIGTSGGYIIKLTSNSMLKDNKKTFVLPSHGEYGQLYYAASITATAKTDVYRGQKWEGRELPDGNCGFVPEDPNNIGTTLYPKNINVPAGYYYNGWGKNNVGPTAARFGLQRYVGKDTLGNDVFKTVFVYVRADGQGGITVSNA